MDASDELDEAVLPLPLFPEELRRRCNVCARAGPSVGEATLI